MGFAHYSRKPALGGRVIAGVDRFAPEPLCRASFLAKRQESLRDGLCLLFTQTSPRRAGYSRGGLLRFVFLGLFVGVLVA